MIKRLVPFAALLLLTGASEPQAADPVWTKDQFAQLRSWLRAAPEEGLTAPDEAAVVGADQAAAASRMALALARSHLFGCTAARQRAGWNIAAGDERIDLPVLLAAALARNDLDGFFRSLRPRHPEYELLRRTLLVETDPGRRIALIRNLERWRWVPLDLGKRYLLVNAAGFEVGLWENGHKTAQWRVIVGKPGTPTPVFSAIVTGVTVNPWWDVPPSIVAESVGRLVRTKPAEARRRGYVWGGGSYRQRPGPGNALGLVKLAMPNPYRVYLHDTPNKTLFDQPARAFSHGCVRVDKALELAARLLGRSVGPEVARGSTVTLPLSDPLPVYVTYFTADGSDTGAVRYHADLYGRDARMGDALNPIPKCPA